MPMHTKAVPRNAGTVRALRRQIDRIDRRLLRLLNQRARLALRVGCLKRRVGQPVFDGAREAIILRRLIQANRGPLAAEAIREVFRNILRRSRHLEARNAPKR